jgi:uncharacterized membrane protein YccF (DUF307 family)
MKKPFATPFIVYNYLTALFLVYLMITYNIGFWPFSENLVKKSYLPKNNKVQKYFTVTTLLVFQILLFLFIGYILTNQHTSILMLISSNPK